jgi:hemerythrin-like domain-containing protein
VSRNAAVVNAGAIAPIGERSVSVRSSIKNATNAVLKTIAPDSDAVPGTDILDTLKKEHDEVKSLLSALQDASTAAQRKSLVRRIKAALVPHTKAEENVLYDAVIALKDKDAQINGHEGYLEHQCASKILTRLGQIENATSPEHKAAAKVLKELVEHHIDEEERNVWGDAKKHFSDEKREQMNVAYLAAKRRVKIA